MWEKIRVIFTIPELRQKILLTLLFLAIYRVGWHIPVPMFNQEKMQEVLAKQQKSGQGGVSDLLTQLGTFSASQLNQATIFGLGIMPYISASIIFQLLASVYPPLEKLQKEGETGRKKINEYTRYATVLLCIGQSWFFMSYLASPNQEGGSWVNPKFLNNEFNPASGITFWWQLVGVMTMTAGTIFLMWLGEQIDEYGIGNGISLLIMAGIVSRFPNALAELLKPENFRLGVVQGQGIGLEGLVTLIILFIGAVVGVVLISQGQRRIPTQSAKHVRGRRVYGGTRQYLPLRVNQAGVMPIIFASSLLMFPQMILTWAARSFDNALLSNLEQAFHRGTSFTYNLFYVVLIYFFCYFWTAITFNPKDMSENLKNYGTFIPGYRPGRRTADYLEKVMVRITYVGAGFLALVAIVPTIITGSMPAVSFNVAQFYGGTSLLIAVSVAFDLVQKIDSHLVMRNYRGLLES
jgi:preprotein translocase subunit SecY